MKKNTLIASLLFVFSTTVYSQGWLEIGAKGGYGMDFLINKNISSDPTHVSKFSFGYMYGGKLGWNFNEEHAVTVDVLYSQFTKNYDFYNLNADSTKTFGKKNFAYNSIDFLLMYRHTVNASYFEIGPQYSILQKAVGSDDVANVKNLDITKNFASSYLSAAIGAGAILAGAENFRLTLGVRVVYTFDDIVSPQGQLNNFPTGNSYSSSQKTNPISAMMVMEFNYDLGFFAKSNCKKKKTSFLFFKNR